MTLEVKLWVSGVSEYLVCDVQRLNDLEFVYGVCEYRRCVRENKEDRDIVNTSLQCICQVFKVYGCLNIKRKTGQQAENVTSVWYVASHETSMEELESRW